MLLCINLCSFSMISASAAFFVFILEPWMPCLIQPWISVMDECVSRLTLWCSKYLVLFYFQCNFTRNQWNTMASEVKHPECLVFQATLFLFDTFIVIKTISRFSKFSLTALTAKGTLYLLSQGKVTRIRWFFYKILVRNIGEYNSVELTTKMSYSGVKSMLLQFAIVWLT